MRLVKLRYGGGSSVGILTDSSTVRLLDLNRSNGPRSLAEILHSPDAVQIAHSIATETQVPLTQVRLLAPIDGQDVWAAGVTYKRSEEARKRESMGAALFYDKVYSAERPELFFKATAARVVGPGEAVRVRRDSRWSVPEPELAVVIAPDLRIVGYSIGNDMSARDIEGENPLYLPQAKVYDQSCAMGPAITLASAMPAPDRIDIRLRIYRSSQVVFEGMTTFAMMKRSPQELVEWLARDNSFPNGVVLFTGTGIVPPDDFTLQSGDRIEIAATGIGELVNPVL